MKQKPLHSQAPTRILPPEQLRYCQILRAHGQLETTALSQLYAERRKEPDDYFKTYAQLRRLSSAGIVDRAEIQKRVEPHNALRKVALWCLTNYGEQVLDQSLGHYRAEYERRQKELSDG